MNKQDLKKIMKAIGSQPGIQMAKAKTTGNWQMSRKQSRKGSRRVSAPAAVAYLGTSGKPTVNGRQDSIVVRHREYITDVTTSTEHFAVDSWNLNPGLKGTFPWLSAMANQYESYRVLSFKAVYEPSCASNALGAIYLAIDYDAADNPPTNKQVMTSYSNCSKGPVWQRVECVAPRRDLEKMCTERYTRFSDLENVDIKTYDFGKLLVATGNGTGFMTGEVWLEYEIQLTTPQIPSEPEYGASAKIITGVGVSAAAPFAGSTISGGLPVEVVNSSTLKFKTAGEYLIELFLNGTVMGYTPADITRDDADVKLNSTIVSADQTHTTSSYSVKVKEAGGNLTFNFIPAVTTLVSAWANISPYAFSL